MNFEMELMSCKNVIIRIIKGKTNDEVVLGGDE